MAPHETTKNFDDAQQHLSISVSTFLDIEHMKLPINLVIVCMSLNITCKMILIGLKMVRYYLTKAIAVSSSDQILIKSLYLFTFGYGSDICLKFFQISDIDP